YFAFVDMSGGSNDSAVLAIAYQDPEYECVNLAAIMDQGKRPPFAARDTIENRFVPLLREYRCGFVVGANYAGTTFPSDFPRYNIRFEQSTMTASQMYQAIEPLFNQDEIDLLDIPDLETQFLSLIWRGQKIDHPNGEHDDWANAATGALLMAYHDEPTPDYGDYESDIAGSLL